MFGDISKRIADYRKLRGMTQSELAKKIGKSLRTVQKYESGDIDISVLTLVSIAEALNLSPNSLIGMCLTDKAAKMLWELRKDANTRLLIIFVLLDQAADDIDADYPLDEKYNGSVLNAICRYLEHYVDDLIKGSLDTAANSADRRIILEQITDALKDLGESEL